MLSEVICSQSFSYTAWTAGPVRRDFVSCHYKLSSQPHHCNVFVYSYLSKVSAMAASLRTKPSSKLKVGGKGKLLLILIVVNSSPLSIFYF